MSVDFAALRSSTDLVELVGRYIDLKRSGHEYVAPCPFHGDKTPSFYVNGEKGSFYCFGCGAKGDALDFVQMIDGLTLKEAVAQLDGKASAPRPRPTRVPVSAEPRPGPDAAALWRRLALSDPAGEAYLAGRHLLPAYGISDVLRYNVGGSGDWWLNAQAHEGYRIAFAIRNPHGNIQTISLRRRGRAKGQIKMTIKAHSPRFSFSCNPTSGRHPPPDSPAPRYAPNPVGLLHPGVGHARMSETRGGAWKATSFLTNGE